MTQNASSSPLAIDTDKLSGMLAELRGVAEIPIGIGEEIALMRLLSELIAQGALNSLEDVRGYIAPLLTRSEADRKLFDQAFSRWFGLAPPQPVSLGAPSKAASTSPTPRRASLQARLPGWINQAWPWALAIAVLVYVAVTLQPTEIQPRLAASTTPPPVRECTDETPQFCARTLSPRAEGFDDLPVIDRVDQVVAGSFGHCARRNFPFETEDPEGYVAFAGMPTLAELTWATASFVDSGESNLGLRCWNIEVADPTDSDALANAVGQIAGLPVNRPLPVAYDPDIAGRIAYAVGVLSNDANLAPLSAYIAAAESNDTISDYGMTQWIVRLDASGNPETETAARIDYYVGLAVSRFGDRAVATGSQQHFANRVAALQTSIDGSSYIDQASVYLDNPVWRSGGDDYDETTLEDAFWLKFTRPGVFAAFLLLLALWMASGLDRRKAFLRRRRPLYPPSIHTFVTTVARATPFSSNGLRRTIQALQQWTSRQSERLDIDKTLDKTLSEGVFSPVRAEVKGLPEYLVLIETRGNGDQETQRLRSLVKRLEDAHILVSVYYYEGNPYWCRSEAGELKDGANPLAGAIHTIDELKTRYPDHRLIVLGEGETFIDPVTEIANRGARALMDWDERAMLTPTALRSWGAREFTIAQALKLPLGRATEDGTAALPALLGLDGRDRPPLYTESGDGFARSLPMLIETRAERWLGDAPVPEKDWERLDQALRNYLDPVGYIWLSACAVYPELRWDLTLYLGQNVKAGGDQTFYSEARLADLLKLPWMRAGRMPDWLREKLINGLAPDTAKQVRRLLRRLIDDATEGDAVGEEDALRLRIATEEPGEEMPLQDTVFLDFLVGGQTTDLELDRDEDKDQRTAKRGSGGGDQISKMLWKAGLLWSVFLLGILPFGGQIGLFDWNNPVDMIYTSDVWVRVNILTFGALPVAALSLFIIDPSSVTYRRWHTFSSLSMSTIVATVIVVTIVLLMDVPLWIVWKWVLDFIKEFERSYPAWDWLIADDRWWIALAAVYAFGLHLVLYPLAARWGLMPPTRDVPLRRRMIASLFSLPITLAMTLAVAIIIPVGARGLSGETERLEDSLWDWGTIGQWPIILLVIGGWLVVLRGLIGLSRRWRRLAMHPPASVNRRGHRLMTVSIILRLAGVYAAAIMFVGQDVLGPLIFDVVLESVLMDGLATSLFPDAESELIAIMGVCLLFCLVFAPGLAYAWVLDRNQSPDVGVRFDFRGRGKAFMVALGRVLCSALLGFTIGLIIYNLPFGPRMFQSALIVAISIMAVFELAARLFSSLARRHRQAQPKRARAPTAFGPAWLKWSGVGLVASGVFAVWYVVIATIPPGQRLGPSGATSVALDDTQSLALADENGDIRFWSNRGFGFAETLNVGASFDGRWDPIVRVSVDPNTGLQGCFAWQRQSGAWEIRQPNGDLMRFDEANGNGGVMQIAMVGNALLMTQAVDGARAAAEPTKSEPRMGAREAYVMLFADCQTGRTQDELYDYSGRMPTAVWMSNADPIMFSEQGSIVSGGYKVGFADGSTSTINYPVSESVSETLANDQPVIGFSEDGDPIHIPAIGQTYTEGLRDDIYWVEQSISSAEADAQMLEEQLAEMRANGETGPRIDDVLSRAEDTRLYLDDLQLQRRDLIERLGEGDMTQQELGVLEQSLTDAAEDSVVTPPMRSDPFSSAADDQAEQDLRDWRQAEFVDTPNAYQIYLKQQPNGVYADEARARVNELEASSTR